MNYGIYRFYLSFEGMREGRVGSGNENGPNNTSLGYRYVFFFKNRVFYIVTNGLYCI